MTKVVLAIRIAAHVFAELLIAKTLLEFLKFLGIFSR